MPLRKLLLPAVLMALSTTLSRAADEQVSLWAGGAPGSEGKTDAQYDVKPTGQPNDVRRIAGIHNPSITLHLPSPNTATGAGVVILPGGGHRYLSIDNEGNTVGNWLAEHGVAAFVLKYRLAKEENSTYRVEVEALQDVQRALRLVRSNAKQWNVDSARVGVLGFSAGGELAKLAAARSDLGNSGATDPIDRESSRPAFQALMYPGGKSEGDVAKDAPPAWICVAADDKLSVPSVEYFQKLRAAGVNAEIHVYSEGGHGFGMRNRPIPITGWPDRFLEWLSNQGFLKSGAVASAQ